MMLNNDKYIPTVSNGEINDSTKETNLALYLKELGSTLGVNKGTIKFMANAIIPCHQWGAKKNAIITNT